MKRTCDYGCGQEAIRVSANDKACCSSHHSKCPRVKKNKERSPEFYRDRAQKSAAAKRSLVNDKGQDIYEVARLKALQTREAVKLQDPEFYQRAAKAMVKTKKETFIDGRSIEDLALDKWRENRSTVGNDGKTSFERAGSRMSGHLNSLSDDQIHTNAQIYGRKARDSHVARCVELGEKPYAASTAKAVQTRLNDIDENGLNGFDRAFLKGWGKGVECKRYQDTNLYYQGSFELAFLDQKAAELGSTDTIKRGPAVVYDFNGPRTYLADFQIGNTIYEIKSEWTWWNTGKNSDLLQVNTAKLDAALSAGYDVVLVLEGEEITWPSNRWSDPDQLAK